MLLIESDGDRFVVIQNHKSDLELLGQLDDILGWEAESINLLAPSALLLKHDEQIWMTRPFRSVFSKTEAEEIEYLAYGIMDDLKSAMAMKLTTDVLLTSYHEIATNWFHLMLAYKAAAKTPHCVAVVDSNAYECFRLAGTKLRSKVFHLTVGWKYRNRSIFSRERQSFIFNQFLQKHPLIVRRFTLLISLVRNDKRAKNFRKRTRIRFLRWSRGVLGFRAGDIGKLFERQNKRIQARFNRVIQAFAQWGQRLQESAAQIEENRRSSFTRWQLRIGTFFAGSLPEPDLPEFEALPDLGDNNVVVITVSDSGSRVNLDPALQIAAALKKRGLAALLVTDSVWFSDKIETEGMPVIHTGKYTEDVRGEKLRWPLRSLMRNDPVLASAIQFLFEMNWPYYMRRQRHLYRLYDQIAQNTRIQAVFSINETLPLAVAFGRKANASRIPWVGHFPILVGRRPDGYFFPAPYHLAYGDQIRDHMIGAGKRPGNIEVVGAYTYDKHHGRDRAADRRRVEEDFPRAKGKKLVTVGTEAFPDPETELGPVLSAVPYLEGVHVVLKLHPSDQMSDFEAMAERLGVRDRIDIVKQYPLGQLLGASDLLIVVVSNIAIEAAIIGTPTLICDFSGKADVVDFVAEGLSIGCEDPARVGEMVHAMLFDEATATRARELLQHGIRRFNGPNDGHSSERIADYFVRPSTGWLSGLRQRIANSMYPKPDTEAAQNRADSA